MTKISLSLFDKYTFHKLKENFRNMKWFGLEGSLKIIYFQAIGRDTFQLLHDWMSQFEEQFKLGFPKSQKCCGG